MSQKIIPTCTPEVFRHPEQQEVWKTHASILCCKTVLINFSLALLPVFLKTFLVDPGFLVKRDLDGNSHIQFSPYTTVLQIGTSGWSKLILSHPQMASAARRVVSVGRPIILTS